MQEPMAPDEHPSSKQREVQGLKLFSYLLRMPLAGYFWHFRRLASAIVKLIIWIRMEGVDTNLGAELYEILPHGSGISLRSATTRVRYRDLLPEEKLVAPARRRRMCSISFCFSPGRLRRVAG
jgi:hypothetical protein